MLPSLFEPKRKNRFVLMIEGVDAFLVKTASRPTITTEEVAMPFVNSHRYLAGKTTFGDVSCTLHDAIAPSASQQVMEWIRLHYESVSGRAGYADFYKRDVAIKMLDPVGSVIEYWDGKGVWIKESNFGELSYEDHGPVDISLTLRADQWILQF